MSIEFENKPLEWGVDGVEPSDEKKTQGFANLEAPAAGHWDYKFRNDFLVQKELQEKVSELSEKGIDTSTLVTKEEFTSHKTDSVIHVTQTNKDNWNGKYTKPTNGIPKTDLDSSVQSSLNKAESALQSVPNGTATTKGVVQLTDSTTSTSTTTAATPNSVKQVNDALTTHKSDVAPHQYGGKFEWRYNSTTNSLDLVVL